MMRYYTYFPGCSSSDGGAKAYGASLAVVGRALDIELAELDDWNCCGSTPYASTEELASFCASARNLALAEKRGLDLVTPCSSCYVVMNNTNQRLQEYPKLREKVDDALSAGGLEYHRTTRVRHILDVLSSDIPREQIAAQVKRNLAGLKVAAYYGCQVVRPQPGFDDPENPTTLDRLIEALGATPTAFPMKARCCGGSLIIPEEDVALELIYKLLDNAASHMAEVIVTVCPLCQTNLDVYQGRVNRKFKTNFNLPVLFFTQLMGLAFGLDERQLGLEKCIVPAGRALTKYT